MFILEAGMGHEGNSCEGKEGWTEGKYGGTKRARECGSAPLERSRVLGCLVQESILKSLVCIKELK